MQFNRTIVFDFYFHRLKFSVNDIFKLVLVQQYRYYYIM